MTTLSPTLRKIFSVFPVNTSLLFFCLTFLSNTLVLSQNVQLDSTFGLNGLATLDNGNGSPGRSTMIAVDADGKILLGGFSLAGISEPFSIARFLANGSPDMTFGQGGVAQHAKFEGALKIAPLPNGKILVLLYPGFALARLNADGSEDTAFQSATVPGDEGRRTYNSDVLVQPDGKILVTAFNLDDPFDQYAIARFLENGAVDVDFGVNGLAHFNSNWAGLSQSIALQPDGKILVTGSNGYDKISVLRYLENGQPDLAFGLNGLAIGTQDLGDAVYSRKILVQPDGKILVAANVSISPQNRVSLYRLNPNGSPDTSFGSNGYASSTNLTKIYGLSLQPNGQIVLGGLLEGFTDRTGLIKFNSDGTPDNTYTGSSSLSNWEASNDGEPVGFDIQPDGKMLAAFPTITSVAPSAGFFAVRLLQSGDKDPSFSGDGVAYASYDSGDDIATGVALQSDGKIVVIGDTYSNYLNVKTMLTRYTTQGTLDPTFGSNGKKLYSLSAPNNNYAFGVTVQPDGKILAAIGFNYSSIDLKVVRFASNGSVDGSFGTNGIVSVPGSFFRVSGISLQPDGKILVGGTLQDRRFAVVRLLANGSPDASFGSGGTAAVAFGTPSDYGICSGFTLLPDGKIVVAGSLYFAGIVAAARFQATGQLDPGFSGDGKAQFTVADDFYPGAMNVQSDGKILVTDANNVVRIQADGSALDASFGTNGIAAFNFANGSPSCKTLTVLSNGKILGLGKTADALGSYFAVGMLLPNGSPAPNGLFAKDLGYRFADFTNVALQTNGRIVAVGGVRQATDIDFGILRYNTGVLVGVSEQALPQSALMASPNPFNNTIQLDLSFLPDNVQEVAIFDLSGKKVYAVNHFTERKVALQGFGEWLPGVYLLRTVADSQVYVQKLIKQ